MYKNRNIEVFPVAIGNEEETGMLIDHGEGFDEPYSLVERVSHYIPSKLHYHDQFLSNGAKIYAGGSGDEIKGQTNLERATAECTTIDQFVHRIRANEQLLVDIAESYASSVSEQSAHPNVDVRIQRRVVDTNGNRKGCHDNLCINPLAIDASLTDAFLLNNAVLSHLANRNVITGAGVLHADGSFDLSQKVGGLSKVEGYGYKGTMYRLAREATDHRLEIRCNDVNLSDWAIRQRIGGTALALAISATPLRDSITTEPREHDYYSNSAIQKNRTFLSPDGEIIPSPVQKRSIEHQKHIALIALADLQEFTGKLSDELEQCAIEALQFCNDAELVFGGDAPVELLADRADWAAKLHRIQQAIQEDKDFGFKREVGDVAYRAIDLKYDHIAIRAVKGSVRTRRGYGYKLRDSGAFKSTAIQEQIDRAYYQPPESTRAITRATLLKTIPNITNVDWSIIRYEENAFSKYTIDLGGVIPPQVPTIEQEESPKL